MEPAEAVKYIDEDSFLITPGDRQDVIWAALGCFSGADKKRLKISGIVLSGGITPGNTTMDLLAKAGIPVLLAKDDTYTVASYLHDVTVKIRPQDTGKINTAVKLIKDNVDLDSILKGI